MNLPDHMQLTTADLPRKASLSVQLASLTEAESHALETHLRYAADESFDAGGQSQTVRELDGLSRYVRNARKSVLGTGRKPAQPQTRLDSTEMRHESVLGPLDNAERKALAVHMDAAQREYRDAGGHDVLLLELISEANHTAYAATAELQGNGLMHGRTLPR